MDTSQSDAFTREKLTARSRRGVLAGLTSGLLSPLHSVLRGGGVAAKKKRSKKGKRGKILCRSNGRSCTKPSERCKRAFCLKTPFTIEARWSVSSQDHDAILFVPNAPGNSDPSPFVGNVCLAGDTNNGTLYPFAFMSGDVQGPGDEVATVQRLLAGRYEFWARIDGPSVLGDLKVHLRNASGKVIDTWESPPNPSSTNDLLDWHVFDIDGVRRSVTKIDEAGIDLLDEAHPDDTYACPP